MHLHLEFLMGIACPHSNSWLLALLPAILRSSSASVKELEPFPCLLAGSLMDRQLAEQEAVNSQQQIAWQTNIPALWVFFFFFAR